jgi:5-methyltetrahydrofolate--homocysteine methyltransferase
MNHRERNIVIEDINFDEALRYLGYGGNVPDDKTKELLLSCGKQLKCSMEGKFVYKVFGLRDGHILGADFILQGQAIKNHLKNCNKVIFMCATLSAGVDLLIRRQQITGMAEAMITDSLASAVIEQVCDKAEEVILRDFAEYEHTWRFGLGYDDFPLECQKQFLDILDAPKRIGVCVNDSMMLTPTKSVTCVIGLGHGLNTSTKRSCEMCSLKEKCQFRKQGLTCGK